MSETSIKARCIDYIAKDLGIDPLAYLDKPIQLVKEIRTRIFELQKVKENA